MLDEDLWAGDYSLKGFEDIVAVERKASIDELYNNLFTEDWVRAEKAFDKLSCVKRPFLLLDIPLGGMSSKGYTKDLMPTMVLDRMYRLAFDKGINILWASSGQHGLLRYLLAEQVLRLMLNAAFTHQS